MVSKGRPRTPDRARVRAWTTFVAKRHDLDRANTLRR
jgi:hypothetical protein